ncbi:hypothetical protein CVU83_00210 [Candidatus Falkowbacteria bacterium HGW-Falkowbacteria-2]|uniref:Uncharacterized protein n=1 Tax=Candidatus Falkowbacteria bacterium HGW-Falkowbacteria-2 TaxID=2013769 RepID=A0A2N2E3M8_9BACT|nr:MAG: hypothetical protein CVU83_00210 [Candidatus Falkowbacteria bacterium HGW-Falkowbacteria-2]
MPVKKGSKRKTVWWNRRVPIKYLFPFIGIIFLLSAFSIYNLYLVISLRQDISEEVQIVRAVDISEVNSEPLIPLNNAEDAGGRMSSFGDNFSGLGYINEQETDLFWDENITAFTFPPVYELTKKNDCSEAFCGISLDATDQDSICLPMGCLSKTENNRILFNSKELILPPALSKEIISDITLASFGADWLIGLVTGPTEAERGWIYRFDGLAYTPLITDASEHQILPRFERGGGKIAFGGDASDYIALYAGYDGKAFRFRNGAIEDISNFFGLRVTDRGFRAQILKAGAGREAVYYICSVSEGKPKFIKIWSQDEANSGGALDFSPFLFKGDFQPEQMLCAISDVNEKRLAIVSRRGGAYEMHEFIDKGFDNSRARQVTSVNVNLQKNETVKSAVFADLGLLQAGNYESYLSNGGEFEAIRPYLWHTFEKEGSELYYRLFLEPQADASYSPWLDHVNRLDYILKD